MSAVARSGGEGGSARSPRSGRRPGVPLVGREPDELHPTVATLDHPEEAVAVAFAVERDAVVVEPAEASAVQRELDSWIETSMRCPDRCGAGRSSGEHATAAFIRRRTRDVAPDLHGRPLGKRFQPAPLGRIDPSPPRGT
jgi:hypothetical protein